MKEVSVLNLGSGGITLLCELLDFLVIGGHESQKLKNSVGIDGKLVGNLRKTQSELTVEAGGKNIVDVVGLHVER